MAKQIETQACGRQDGGISKTEVLYIDQMPCRYIVDENEDEWFMAEDIAPTLRINYEILNDLPVSEKRLVTIETYEGERQVTMVSNFGRQLLSFFLLGRASMWGDKTLHVTYRNYWDEDFI